MRRQTPRMVAHDPMPAPRDVEQLTDARLRNLSIQPSLESKRGGCAESAGRRGWGALLDLRRRGRDVRRFDADFGCDLLDLRQRKSPVGICGQPFLPFGGPPQNLRQLLLGVSFAGSSPTAPRGLLMLSPDHYRAPDLRSRRPPRRATARCLT